MRRWETLKLDDRIIHAYFSNPLLIHDLILSNLVQSGNTSYLYTEYVYYYYANISIEKTSYKAMSRIVLDVFDELEPIEKNLSWFSADAIFAFTKLLPFKNS